MTNFEKYKDTILELIANDNRIAINKITNTLCSCDELDCSNCFFSGYSTDYRCVSKILNWLCDECEEVDWSKVPVDAKVLVWNNVSGEWYRRYFAKYENGKIYVYGFGATSWSAIESDLGIVSYTNAKLVQGVVES